MIIVENSEPNFVLKSDLFLVTECGKNIQFEFGEFITLTKLENGDLCLGECCIISKTMFSVIFSKLNNISHIQLEECDTGDMERDGMILKEYVNDSFNLDSYEFPNTSIEVLNKPLFKVLSIN